MTERVRIWLTNLYENEIKEVEETIDNERLQADGSDTKEERKMHEDNIEELEIYLENLEELLVYLNE